MPRTALFVAFSLALAAVAGCQASPGPTSAPAAPGSLHLMLTPTARALQTVVPRRLTSEIASYAATLLRVNADDSLTYIPNPEGVSAGDADDIVFTGLAAGSYVVDVEGRNAQNQPVTLVARGAATLYNGTSATLTLSPQMLPVAFSGTITLPAMPAWDGVHYQAVLSTYADPATALSTLDFTPSDPGTRSFRNVPVGDYVVTVTATGTDSSATSYRDGDRVRVTYDDQADAIESAVTPGFTWGDGPAARTVTTLATGLTTQSVVGMAVSPDGRVAVADASGTLHVYEGGDHVYDLGATPASGLALDGTNTLYVVVGHTLQAVSTSDVVGGVSPVTVTTTALAPTAEQPRYPAAAGGLVYTFDDSQGGSLTATTPGSGAATVLATGLGAVTSLAVDAVTGEALLGYADGAIARRATDGSLTPLVPAGRYGLDAKVALGRGGDFYFTGTGDASVYQVVGGVVSRLAGMPFQQGTTDGLGGLALFTGFSGLGANGGGTVYVFDTGNQSLRMF